MLLNRIARALSMLAVAALPALSVAPIHATAAGATRTDNRPARVIVKYKADGVLMREQALGARGNEARVQHAARLSQRHGIALIDGHAIAPRMQVLHARNVSSAALVARLQADPDVEYAEVDQRVRRADVPNDPLYGPQAGGATPTVGQWYLRPPDATLVSAINAQAAWDVTTGSSTVVVAVLDTGVRMDHPDLAGKLVAGYDFVSQDSPGVSATANDLDGRDPDPSDPGDWVTQFESNQIGGPLEDCDVDGSSWHGTQTAALIGAATNNGSGMASVGRNVRILPVRVLGKCGGFTSDIIAAMRWAAGLSTDPVVNPFPAKVLNLSLGSPGACGSYQATVSELVAAGVSVVVSAGNEAGLAVGRPANCVGAIGVGGLRHVGTKVGFSDVGTEIALSAPGGNCVNLGNGPCLFPILTATNDGTTGPGTNTFSDSFNISVGTSFSAPLVAGTVGLMRSINTGLSPAQIKIGLMRTTRAFPTTGAGAGIPVCHAPTAAQQDECYCTTSTCGAGMLNASGAAAVASVLKAWIVSSASQVAPSGTVSLAGDASWAVAPATVTSHAWTIESGSAFATLQDATLPAASLTAVGPGAVVVRLTVTDSNGNTAIDDTTIDVATPSSTPASGGGGGAMSWAWMLALGIAVAALRPKRR